MYIGIFGKVKCNRKNCRTYLTCYSRNRRTGNTHFRHTEQTEN
jgi:hypothetical protein